MSMERILVVDDEASIRKALQIGLASENFEIDLGDRLDLKPQKADGFRKILGTDKSRLIVIYCRSFR